MFSFAFPCLEQGGPPNGRINICLILAVAYKAQTSEVFTALGQLSHVWSPSHEDQAPNKTTTL